MSNHKYQVLVAEDEPIILQDTVQEIDDAELGFQVKWTAYNGQDALDILESERPDVIFTDIRMPIMSGMEFIGNVRRMYPTMPIVILTGFSEFEYARQAIQYQVEDYLLKPLEAEELRRVLQKIYSRLEEARRKNERQIVYSKIHGTNEDQTLPFQHEGDMFELYLIQIGNQYDYGFSQIITEKIQKIWYRVDREGWLTDVCGERTYWLIDEKKPNQKFLIVDYRRSRSLNERISFAEKIQLTMLERQTELPVHIVLYDAAIKYHDIWPAAGCLRGAVEETAIGSEIIVYGQERKNKEGKVPFDLKRKIEIDIENGNLKGIKEELSAILEYAEKQSFTQKQTEAVISQIYEITKGYDREQKKENQERIRTLFFNQKSIPLEEVCQIMEEDYLQWNTSGNPEVSVKEIEDYIQRHYAENITVTELSRKFHFNGNYLTRIFKKYVNESPMNYLIQTRLKKAVELMETREDLDIRQISQMVGYEDSHYFSRIFKNKLGISPSDYRKKSMNKEV